MDLFQQYEKHLGTVRFKILTEAQKLMVPRRVGKLLCFRDFSLLTPAVPVYKIVKLMKMDWLVKNLLLPADYREQINRLNVFPA